EETFTHMLTALHKKTGESNLCIAGGAAMNSVYNGKIHAVTPFKSVFVSSCPDDTGVSVGAALYAYHCQAEGKERPFHKQTYWGPSYGERELEETLKKYKLKAARSENVAKETARMLAAGKLVGWFQGGMEFGQRALGNRSILADPRGADVKDKVNAAVKYREG